MIYSISWFLVFILLALWSLTAWALHAAAAWVISNAGALKDVASGAASGTEGLHLPEWLTSWLPAMVTQALTSLMADLAPAIVSLFQAAPSLAGALTIATWVLWSIGSVLLILLGAGLHVLILVWRRRSGGSGPLPTGQAPA
jgi:hypothetical protein